MKYHTQEDRIKIEKKINILLNYIKMVLTNTNEQVTQKSLSIVKVLVHNLKLFEIEVVIWVVVTIAER